MIGYHLGMHRAGVLLRLFLLLLMVVIVLVVRAIEVNRPYLPTRCECDQRNCARN